MWDLDADKQAFVDAVLAPLPPNDKARDMLEQSVQVASQVLRDGGSEEAREAAARMQASAPGYLKRRFLVRAFGIVTMLAIAWFTLFSPAAFRSQQRVLATSHVADEFLPEAVDWIFFPEQGREWRERMLAQRLTPEQRLVASGDISQDSDSLRWKAVWDRYPEDPSHFLIYAERCKRDGKWPENFVETGERLDPGNGWFRWIEVMSRGVVVYEPAKKAVRATRSTAAVAAVPATIKSDADLASILGDWDRTLEAPRWDFYQERLVSQRMAGWPQAEDFPDHTMAVALATRLPSERHNFWRMSQRFGEFVGTLARHYAARGDKVELEALASRFEKTMERLAGHPADSSVLLLRLAQSSAEGLAEAFTTLGDNARATAFQTFALQVNWKLVRPDGLSSPDALDQRRGNFLASTLSGFAGTRFTPVEEKDLRGGRLAEYAMTERLLMHIMVLLLSLVVLCFWLAGFRERRGPRQACSRLCGLLRPVDRVWIAALGVLLPVLVYLASLRLPWLELRDFALDDERVLPLLALACGLLISMVLGTAEAVHWRLSRSGAIAGFGSHGLKPGRWIAVLAMMSMPVSVGAYQAFVKWSLDDKWIHAMFASLAALPLLWMLWVCFGFFFGATHRRLQRLTCARALLPFLILATLLTALAIPALHEEEKYWTRRISYEAVTPRNPLFNDGAGSEQALWLQGQLRTALDDLGKARP